MVKPTHIIKLYPTTESELLFRASDGMLIAMKEKVTVIYGDNPNKRESRLFIDSDSASRYLRDRVAFDDLNKKNIPEGMHPIAPYFKEIDEEASVIQPGNAFVMPGGGSIHRMS